MSGETSETPLFQSLCPHWFKEKPTPEQPMQYEIKKKERCRICGHRRVYARLPEVHPSRDPEEELAKLQSPGYEIIQVGERADEVNDLE